MKSNFAILVATLLIGVAVLSAQNRPACTNHAIAGTYSLTCSGWIAAGPGGSLVPMMQVGVATGDPAGNWSGVTTVNIAGQTTQNATVAGHTSVNPDCTGNIVYNKGTATELNINYVANLKTDQIFGLIINPGTVASCTLQRMSR